MRYAVFTHDEKTAYPVCLLVPDIRKSEIQETYFKDRGIPLEDILVMDLHRARGKKKTPVSEMKAYIEEELTPILEDMQVEYLLVADAGYFKTLTKVSKVAPNMGYVLDTHMGPWKVIYTPNYRTMFYDPDKVRNQVAQSMDALEAHRSNSYKIPGADIIKFADYPRTETEIAAWLEKLLEMNCPLAIDIETFSLKHPMAGIGTITFCWNEHEGIAFPVDIEVIDKAQSAPFFNQLRNDRVRALLKDFFYRSRTKHIYHSISFDVYILVYQLFMDHILDTEGLLEGLNILLRDWDCTKLITYLATNSCAGNDLSLKTNAQEFSGNWAKDEIKNITSIPLDQLLQYNLIDGLSTWYVHNKHYKTMVADQQLQIYNEIFKPATVDIIQMQLTGLPLNRARVSEVRQILESDEAAALKVIRNSDPVRHFTYVMQEDHVAKRNSELKTKQITMQDEETKAVTFNPNSSLQLQKLLFDFLGLPVINLTDSNLPSTDKDTLKALVNHADSKDVLELLDALIDYKAVNKILTSFIPAFEGAFEAPDGWHYLFGNFNLGGTLSGRLSSSGPNLQNLPSSGTKYAKVIKSCVQAPPGWLFIGLDFDSLEDRISALTTKDPNKLKVYTDGYDGHCLRAYSYFTDQMPDIDGSSVESVNSIKHKYESLRHNSKAPTFALTYQGTVGTLMNNCGFDALMAQQIYDKYHEMYAVSDEWVATHLNRATETGYVTAAFGLRVRTPLLKQVIRGTSATPYEAEAEGRSAGNALGQSWCLLNTRAGSEFMGEVRKSQFRLDIKPGAQIHDAQYFLVRDDLETLAWVNERLVKAVEWQNHPDIAHDKVKLGGELSIFHPSWAGEITIPNGANANEIQQVVFEKLAAA